jgi:hypothetical protein
MACEIPDFIWLEISKKDHFKPTKHEDLLYMRDHADYLHWDVLSSNFPFTPEMLFEFKSKINWKLLANKNKNSIKIPDNLLMWALEAKSGKYGVIKAKDAEIIINISPIAAFK